MSCWWPIGARESSLVSDKHLILHTGRSAAKVGQDKEHENRVIMIQVLHMQ